MVLIKKHLEARLKKKDLKHILSSFSYIKNRVVFQKSDNLSTKQQLSILNKPRNLGFTKLQLLSLLSYGFFHHIRIAIN